MLQLTSVPSQPRRQTPTCRLYSVFSPSCQCIYCAIPPKACSSTGQGKPHCTAAGTALPQATTCAVQPAANTARNKARASYIDNAGPLHFLLQRIPSSNASMVQHSAKAHEEWLRNSTIADHSATAYCMHSCGIFSNCKPTVPCRTASRSKRTVHTNLPDMFLQLCRVSKKHPSGNMPGPTTCSCATPRSGHPYDSPNRISRHKCNKLLVRQNLQARKQGHPKAKSRHERILQQLLTHPMMRRNSTSSALPMPPLYCSLSMLYCGQQDTSIVCSLYCSSTSRPVSGALTGGQPAQFPRGTVRYGTQCVTQRSSCNTCAHSAAPPGGLQFAPTTSQTTDTMITS